MSEATCKTCPFWERTDDHGGSCRRHAPQMAPEGNDEPWPPRMLIDEWCGEHPLRQRDRLAAMAMQGLSTMEAVLGAIQTPEAIARDAYAIADAMLAEAAKAQETKP